MGKLVTEYDSRITSDMIFQVGKFDEVVFAQLRRDGFQLYIIEEDDKIVALTTIFKPSFIELVIAHTFWIDPEYRGKTLLINELIKGATKAVGVKMMVSQGMPRLMQSKTENGFIVPLESLEHKEQVYSYGDIFVHAGI